MSLRQRIRRLVRGDPLSSCIKLNETVVFFPTVGRQVGGMWKVKVHGRIYHPLEFSRLRRLGMRIVDGLARLRGMKSEEAKAIFRQRMAEFLADNERGNRIKVRIGEGDALWKLGRSRASGHFEGEVELAAGEAGGAAVSGGDWVGFRALTKVEDERVFEGRALLVPAEGVSVISDIDDTVKVTEVFAGGMLRNTFAREFKGVPEMAGAYRRWAERMGRGGAFHYVSGSPWQLYPFLAAFLREQGFPEGTWHLRDFRLMPRDLLRTMRSSRRVKGRYCRELMRAFPGRRFILVGDSGESDPEMYASLARAFPGQVERIYIRDVKGEGMGAARWGRTFAGLSAEHWRLFREASEIH